LQAWKGPYLALAALRALPNEWRLDFYGDGREREHLELAAEKAGLSGRVQFRGMVAREQVYAALRRADVLLFPSMHDASGYAVAEALALGCPVVCLDIGGPAMLVEQGNGTAVKPTADAPTELAAAMLRARRGKPGMRWRADRLPSIVESWYSRVESAPLSIDSDRRLGDGGASTK
jgi:glycosyltransferase involved in cell wall biosynthesis